MAVKIEKGGWILIFLIGAVLVGYSLNKYGVVNLGSVLGSKKQGPSREAVDTSKPLTIPASSEAASNEVRVRVNIWVGCVGGLVAMGVQRGRKTRPDLKLGICGEHGGDPASIHFFHKVGLDYVSASPYRIPVARLAAAQAALATRVGD